MEIVQLGFVQNDSHRTYVAGRGRDIRYLERVRDCYAVAATGFADVSDLDNGAFDVMWPGEAVVSSTMWNDLDALASKVHLAAHDMPIIVRE